MPPMKPPRPRPTQVRIRATPPPTFRISRSPSPALHQKPKCKACGSESLEPEEGGLTCTACGAIQAQEINFRAEIEFDETPAGAAQTRGTTIKEGQSHRKNFTSRIPGSASAPGHESVKAEENALRDADYWFQLYATNLQIHQPEVQAARQLFSLAYRSALYRGRTLHSLALVSLYLAIRRQNKTQYPLMLIDFAEINDFNVFDLGQIAQDLQKTLFLSRTLKEWQMWDEEQKKATTPEARQRAEYEKAKLRERDKLNLIGPENLIAKFCAKLDFGDMERKVASDAVRVAKSMNRDWMTDGRRPAGVAGAAIIIAARMNNFRRTLREVVLVAKVTELTVGKRIEEFRETKPSNFSVKEFRSHDINSIHGADIQDPPAYYRAQPEWLAKTQKRKRGRPKKNALPETAAEIEGNESVSTESSEEQPPPKQARVDADGFAVPAIPTRSTSEVNSNEPPKTGPRKPGRPPGAKNWQAPPPTAEELEEEAELTSDIQRQLDQNAELNPSIDVGESQEDVPRIRTAGPNSRVTESYPGPSPKDPPGPYVNTNTGNTGYVSLSPTLQADEFEDDEDVAACILTEAERQIKETIWVTENADWLRNEHSKRIKRELKEREMREKGLDPDKEREKAKNKRRKDGMMHSKRVGDVSYLHEERRHRDRAGIAEREGDGGNAGVGDDLEDPEQQADADAVIDPALRRSHREPSSDARQAMRKMLQQRGTYSRRVDYESLSNAYKLPGMDDASDDTSSNNRTASASPFLRPNVSRGLISASKRRARDSGKAQRENSITTVSSRRSASGERGSGSPSQNERDTDFEDSAPSTLVPVSKRKAPQQLPTPRATQITRATASRGKQARNPEAEDMDVDVDAAYPATRARTQRGTNLATSAKGKATPARDEDVEEEDADQEASEEEEEVSNDEEGEEEEDEDEDEDDAEPIDPDSFFAHGKEGYVGGEEEEVTDDEGV